jgi:hypothetical protein
MVLPSSSGETYSVGSGQSKYPSPIEASSIDWTQQSRFYLMMREEPSLETFWLKKKIRMMDNSK